ncbi:Vacuolar protein sorting-associated protein 53 [Lambiella insularis]|nr:Vacuolar protein sorting-associated protein 53 [Lambiella insularis]
MPADYSSTARALALPVSPTRPANPNHPPMRTSWPRTISSTSRGPGQSPYGLTKMSLRDRVIDGAVKLRRRATKTYMDLSTLQKILATFFVLASLTITILFFVYNERIFAWLEPIAEKWKNLNGGWLILWAMTFVTAFPPVIGYATCVTLAGFVYGFPNGWFIVATANVAGSLCSFITSRTLLSSFVNRLVAKDTRFSAFSAVLKHDGLKILVMIRLCPLPYSLSNGFMATVPTLTPLLFALATALASPKLLIHVFIGSRMAAIAKKGEKMDRATKAVNYASIAAGMILGAVTGWLIYQRTVARAHELEAEERAKSGRPRGLSHPDEFADDMGGGDEEMGAGDDDIDFLDGATGTGEYRDEQDDEDVFKYADADGDEEHSIADYDPIDHLNAIFSHPSTLSSVSKTSRALQTYERELDDEIAERVAQQIAADGESVQRMQAAQAELSELFQKIESVRERAMHTEQAITEMTADIKRLDNTKRNLTLSMTALKRLQMLTTAYEQLRGLSTSRQYKECAQLLQAVIQLMSHFKSYRSIDQIATLSRNVSDVQREVLEQVCEDFEVTFAKGEVAQRKGMLAEACLVMDALGENARSRLITWYCNTQLREYRQVFRGSDEAGSLDNISRRYSWFKRMLKTYDDQHAAIFPSTWRVDEMLANAFCEGTRDDFKAILAKSTRRADGQTLDVNLLLSCLQETLEFEHSLERKLTNSSRMSIDTFTSVDEKVQPFAHAISEAFEPYLSVWVEAQERQMSTMLPKYRQQPLKPPDEEFSPQMVVSSSTELYSFYRQSFAQCAKLSTGAPLVELSKVFARYLDQYAHQVLLYHISERPSGQTPSRFPTIEDTIIVLNTADYCFNTCTQLEERIKSRVDENLRNHVDFQSQEDAFMGVASAAIRGLVRKVEADLEPAWREMRNTGWSKLQGVSDQSPYVAELLRRVNDRAGEILAILHKQQYARAFCDNLVELLANAYTANIVQCRPISEIGAEQMLLDSYILTKGFEDLITITSSTGAVAPAGYVKRVQQTMGRLLPLLKTLQVRPSPPEALVQAYLIHIADKSDTNFRKVLDMKGVRKQDQGQLIELFVAHKAGPRNESLPQYSAFLTAIVMNNASGGSSIGSLSNAATLGSANLHNLQGRFDPSTFGSAIMTAARDGVDRLGTPALGGSSGVGSRAVSPPPGSSAHNNGDMSGTPSGNVNQNLRSIGKFFKRDLSSLGNSFRGSRSGEDGGK